jgi:MFS superfamily sulfate permease-like transporter
VADAGNGSVTISVHDSAVFSSWIPLRKKIVQHENAKEMVVDLSDTRMVDHTVMAKLTEMQKEFAARDCKLVIAGLDEHRSLSDHPLAARKKKVVK